MEKMDLKVVMLELKYIKEAVDDIRKRQERDYATKAEVARVQEQLKNTVNIKDFVPVRKIVYGMVSLILTSAFLALISLVIKQ